VAWETDDYGLVLMSERDIRRIEVLTEVISGRRTVASAAVVLAISARQVNRLLIRLRADGGGGLIHKGRGKSSNHSLCDGVRGYVLELVKTKYADFGPTLATEVLLAKHDIQVGRETLRTWMLEEGLWLSRKQRRTFHQPRLRRESYGELVQIDGSDHRWFEQRGEPCTLLVFIDDATSKLMQLRFVSSESTDSYFAALEGYVNDHGCPVAFYSDKHTVFRVNKPDAKGGSGMTQFGRALAELNIEILCANSTQAKGRVERANRTLQDRLVKELRLADICDMSAGNAFLPGFIKLFNEKFSSPAAKAENLHRRLNVQAPPHPDAPTMAPDEDGFIWMPHEAIAKAFAPRATPEEQIRLEAIQRPINVACITEKAPPPSWKTKPCWYLVAEEDRMILEKTQRFMAERMKATIRTAEADHIPSLTMPGAVVSIILEASRSVLGS
jgi:hypothetical protein